MNDLQNGDTWVNVVEAGLIEGFAGVPERIVHINQDFAVLTGVGALQPNAAGEILRDIRAAVNVVAEFLELNAERFIKAFRAQG